jgi:ParB-like chromosome segregation protein Spo0J
MISVDRSMSKLFDAEVIYSADKFETLNLSNLRASPHNARKHSAAQIKAIARSIEAFGFNAPVLLDKDGIILAGHGRVEAAKLLGMTHVPVIHLHHLTDVEAKAYMLADNKLTDRSTWDDGVLAVQLKELSELVPNFDIEATGFEAPEIDFRIQSLEDPETLDRADDFRPASGPSVSRQGDIWHLGDHRIYCGSALNSDTYLCLMAGEKAAACFTDPPYNV